MSMSIEDRKQRRMKRRRIRHFLQTGEGIGPAFVLLDWAMLFPAMIWFDTREIAGTFSAVVGGVGLVLLILANLVFLAALNSDTGEGLVHPRLTSKGLVLFRLLPLLVLCLAGVALIEYGTPFSWIVLSVSFLLYACGAMLDAILYWRDQ